MNWESPLDIIEMDTIVHETDMAVHCNEVDMDPDVAVERFVRSVWGDVVWSAIEYRRSNYGR